MRRTILVALVTVGLAGAASAQTAAPATLRLTVDEAVKMALENNVDLKADRLDPQISDTRVAAAARRVQSRRSTPASTRTINCSRRPAS
jgi:hypothetical protein